MIPNPQGERVEGYLLTANALNDKWAMLDAFEGEEYERVTVPVATRNVVETEAFVYALKAL